MSKAALLRKAPLLLGSCVVALMAGSAEAACPNPGGYANFEFSSTYQSHLAQIKFTPSLSQAVAAKLASPANPSQSTSTTIAILDGYADKNHIDLCDQVTTHFAYSGTFTRFDLHGTHVSGLAGANQNAAGLVGVDPYARLLNIPVFDDKGWIASDLGRAALNHARAQGARVVNMSYGSTMRGAVFLPGELNMLRDYNSATPGQGMVIVRAAGNDGRTILNQGYIGNASADLSHLLIVGSVDSNNKLSSFSNKPGNACMTTTSCSSNPANYVRNFFIVAPGQNIWSDAPNDSMSRLSGTSMAAPLVAGAAGLVVQYALAGNTPLTPGQVANILKLSAKRLGTSKAGTPDSIYGWGLLDVEAALNRPAGGSSIATQSTVNSGLVPFSSSTLSTSSSVGGRTSIERGLSGLVVFDGFGRPFAPQGAMLSVAGSGMENDVAAHTASLASLSKVQLMSQDGWTYHLVSSDAGTSGGALSVLAVTGDDMSMDMGTGVAPGYFTSTVFGDDGIAHGYSRDLALQFYTGAGDAGSALRGRSLFAAFDYELSPHVSASTLMITTAPEVLKSEASGYDPEFGLAMAGDMLDRKTASLFKAGVLYNLEGVLSAGASYGVMLEDGAALGMQSTGAFSLGPEALTQIFGLSLRLDAGTASALSFFAERSRTETSAPGASIFSAVEDWRGSKFGLAYDVQGLIGENDALRLTIARPWLVDQGRLALHVPVGRELDGTVNYSDRLVSLTSDGAPLDLEVHYRGSIAFANYALQIQARDRDVTSHDAAEVTVGGALQFAF